MGDEIQAMGTIKAAMDDLEDDEARRVLRWAIDKYGDDSLVPKQQEKQRTRTEGDADSGEGASGSGFGYERIADLVDAASPSSIAEHVLIGTYWFQVGQGHENVAGQQVNTELKDLGHGSKNITDSYNTLITRKPPLVRQVQKAGTTRQARKRYRLTNEGIRVVEKMLADGAGE